MWKRLRDGEEGGLCAGGLQHPQAEGDPVLRVRHPSRLAKGVRTAMERGADYVSLRRIRPEAEVSV